MGKVLTISVAAYNVEKYLDNLCDSIIASKCLEDLEVLIINDGSKDNTDKIADNYSLMYPGVFYHINKENGGHGSTINKGIELATGKYFKVLDGDDWVNPDGLNSVVEIMKSQDVDLIITDWKRVYENDDKEVVERFYGLEPNEKYDIEEACDLINRYYFHGAFFKTDLLKNSNIHIDEHCFYVDNEILWFPFPYIQTILYSNNIVYCYRLGLADQSVNPNVIAKRIDQHEFVSRRMVDFYFEVRPSLSCVKGTFFDKVIADNIAWHFEALLNLPYGNAALPLILSYREYVIDKAPLAVDLVKTKKVKLLLKHPRLFYPFVKIMQNINNKKLT